MITRRVRTIVEFKRPFLLPAVGKVLPAGRYRVETDEISVDGRSVTAYWRIATRIFPATTGARPEVSEGVRIEAEELAAALVHDAHDL